MEKSGNYCTRPGNTFVSSNLNFCDIIYYSNCNWGYGNDGHFAKVLAWDVTGNPTIIQSKWGAAELIRSTGYNPFTGNIYGSAKKYYKKTN